MLRRRHLFIVRKCVRDLSALLVDSHRYSSLVKQVPKLSHISPSAQRSRLSNRNLHLHVIATASRPRKALNRSTWLVRTPRVLLQLVFANAAVPAAFDLAPEHSRIRLMLLHMTF